MGSVRHSTAAWSLSRPAELAPDQTVWASIVNDIENPAERGKIRPVILVEPDGYAWKTIGLTSPHHRDGASRIAIPNARAVGLKHPAWLWSGTLCTTPGIDIADHVGWVHQALVFEIAKLAGLNGPTIKTLLLAALTHHWPTASPLGVIDEVQP